MMNKASFLITLAALWLAAALIPQAQAAEIWLQVSPQDAGEEVDVSVHVRDVTDLYGLACDLQYDGSALSPTDDGASADTNPKLTDGTALTNGGTEDTIGAARVPVGLNTVVLGYSRTAGVDGVDIAADGANTWVVSVGMLQNLDNLEAADLSLSNVYLEDSAGAGILADILPTQVTQPTGTVYIRVTPDSAPWSLTDSEGGVHSGAGDATLTEIPSGDVSLTWGNLAGAVAPSPNPETRYLAGGSSVTFDGVYELIYATVTINVEPDTASWKLQSGRHDLGREGQGDAVLTDVPAGEIFLTWGLLDDYMPPQPIRDYVVLQGGDSHTFTGVYTLSSTQKWLDNFGYNQGWRVGEHLRMLGDVNGDGMEDVVGYGDTGVFVSLSNGNGFNHSTMWLGNFGSKKGWQYGRHPRFLADINGDGMEDVIGFGDAGVLVGLSAGNQFTGPTLWTPNFGYNNFWMEDKHPRLVKDVNGDGMADLIGFGSNGVLVSLSQGTTGANPTLWTPNFGYNAYWRVNRHPRVVEDVNADGMADVLGYADRGIMVATSDGSAFNAPSLWVANLGYNDYWRVDSTPRTFGDVNGDNMTDCIGFGNEGVMVALSQRVTFGEATRWISNFGNDAGYDYHQNPREMVNLNGDSKDDIVGFANAGVYYSMSLGNDFDTVHRWVAQFGADQGWDSDRHLRIMADVNGDGRADIVGFGDDGVYVLLNGFTTPEWITATEEEAWDLY